MTKAVQHAAVLLTGFGRFPGVEHNASAVMVMRLVTAARREFPRVTFEADVLPVAWAAAPQKLSQLIAEIKPGLALHFGVSARAKGFVVERRAVNISDGNEDERGTRPQSEYLVARGRATRRSTLPVRRIETRLRAENLPVSVSDDAGRYLCNGILYHSLAASRAGPERFRSGFIHIPADLCGAGPRGRDPLPGCALNWDMAIRGGLEILRVCLTSR